jgi:hypothetical protein
VSGAVMHVVEMACIFTDCSNPPTTNQQSKFAPNPGCIDPLMQPASVKRSP